MNTATAAQTQQNSCHITRNAHVTISANTMNLFQPLHNLPGISPTNSKLLKNLGIYTILDLLFYYPRNYIKYRRVRIANLKVGDNVTIIGIIKKHEIISPAKNPKLTIQTWTIKDKIGSITCKCFYNHPYYQSQRWRCEQSKLYSTTRLVAVSGIVKDDLYLGKTLNNPEISVIELADIKAKSSSIIPIYALTKGVTLELVQNAIQTALTVINQLKDPLPAYVRQQYGLIKLKEAIANIHFPPNSKTLAAARRRLVFDEFFYLQLSLLQRRHLFKARASISKIAPTGALIKQFYSQLPFELTVAQQRVINDILNDLQSPTPMNRLVQGDVGAGKTVVAVVAILAVIQSGYQAALMAPTEVLAEQHYRKITDWFNKMHLPVELLTGSTKTAKRSCIQAQLETGELPLLIGTHALIQDKVNFNKLGLVVIDEQHRFGVQQRMQLQQKGKQPHVLTMTATPIPRTLALTLHGDLDVSQIDELPPGRSPIRTKVLTKSTSAYDLIRREVQKGHQAYIVLPLIEESEKLNVRSAIEEHQRLSEKIFPKFKVGLLHGRMTSAQKDEALAAFRDNQTQILVSTTVVEVGVDVPNATVMLIENAERFGLSQLHQLRGRVGRGSHQSYCLLINGSKTAEARSRLVVLEQSQDGFFISEMDMRLRGEGELLGTRQSGLSDLVLANLLEDEEILAIARTAAISILAIDPELKNHPHIRAELARRGYLDINASLLN
ncbi:ATP-dependent DNA helicase RecG [Tolypothrix sp. NIES-4075]|uniref:ATP-dependent DNA helicase RecG n=1 Tax=Tolypothrix sp. NIES-4075 TaxID=2005459 RepID=UPI000B5CAF5D|nr:ATP-dependent DNA helicase RecG [Tolypothrix sp. NIES-4075]